MGFHSHEIIAFAVFLLFIAFMLVLDLGVFNKKSHILSFRESLYWTAVWIGISVVFYLLIRFFGNELHNLTTLDQIRENIRLFRHPINITGLSLPEALRIYNHNLSLEYITGYVIEYSLSVDNIFVIIMIFVSFQVRPKYYKRVLFWGILGAIVMRFIFIFAAGALIRHFEWILYFFGALLVFIGAKMGYEFFTVREESRIDTHHHPVVRFLSRYFLIAREDKGHRFWVRENGKLYITALFIVLVLIEVMDVIFAVDSVPAVFSVTRDPYIVFFSNIFAILGLRSLFFLVQNVMNRFRFLKLGLAFLLVYVGIKMITQLIFDLHFSTQVSFGIIIGILGFFIVLSLLFPGKKPAGSSGSL
ncbi:MAG TPA: TerC/Alx family metal homeostasis membrane protein [Bacteroidales bacterium]|nr:TerC/Alx family metal homeostasis membrane protein [Bacteroidales bacterium]